MFLCASFLSSHFDISRTQYMSIEERRWKPGFAERSRERCASETAEHDSVAPSNVELDMLSSKC